MCLRWSKATITSESISAMSGSPSGSGLGSREALDGAHAVVAEEADRAAGERAAGSGERRLAVRATTSAAASAYGSPPSARLQRSTRRGL